MSLPQSAIYKGAITHRRLRPTEHFLKYKVWTLFVDIDRLAELSASLRRFSHNRFGLVSFYDRDHGPREDRPLGEHIREKLSAGNIDLAGGRIMILCYPRVLGYVFNPLSTYFCYHASGDLRAIVYEVNNTYGERRSYIAPVGDEDRIHQNGPKSLSVSPFTEADGRYSFHVRKPGEEIALGIGLREHGEPVMKALFTGERQPLTDATLARLSLQLPLLSFKVIAAIHWEALKLLLKRTPLRPHRAAPRYSTTLIDKTGTTKDPA